MKRNVSTILLIAGFAGLFALLAALQYRWLVQASEADGEKIQKSLNSDTERFAAHFNREIQNAYFNFQLEPENWKAKDRGEFNDRYDFWKSKTSYPELIERFYFVENTDKSQLEIYDTAKRAFEPAEWTDELRGLADKFRDDRTFQPVYEDYPALVVPVHESAERFNKIVIRHQEPPIPTAAVMPKKLGFLVITLNAATIKDHILPDLTQKYFPDSEYKLSVLANDQRPVYTANGGTSASDSDQKLFDLAPDNFVFYANRDLIPSQDGEKKSEIFVSQKVERHSVAGFATTSDGPGNLKIELTRGEKPRTTVFERTNQAEPSHWMLQVQHRDGSVANFVANTRRKSLAAGFGILSLLATGIFLVFFSAQRSKRLAQRQIDFVSSVSHEFRTPLAVIYSAGENLEDGVAKDDAQVSRYGNLIKGEGKKLSTMVERILEFAGANSGKRRYNFVETDVASVIEDAVDHTRSTLDENGFELETAIADGLPQVSADREALCGAIQNLIVNSVKYSNGERHVKISAENGSGRVKISVEDRGIGISKSDLRHVFEPFYRSKDVVDAQIHGNGLGLSLVKQIADAHGGKVKAESEIGNGSKFTIELPEGKN